MSELTDKIDAIKLRTQDYEDRGDKWGERAIEFEKLLREGEAAADAASEKAHKAGVAEGAWEVGDWLVDNWTFDQIHPEVRHQLRKHLLSLGIPRPGGESLKEKPLSRDAVKDRPFTIRIP